MKEFLKNFFDKVGIREVFAIIYLVMCLSFVYVLALKAVPTDNKDLVNVLGGAVFGGLPIILGFYYGASKKDKPDQL